MHIRWFGEAWGLGGPAPICDPGYWLQDPGDLGIRCLGCEEWIEWNHRGVAMSIVLGDREDETWRREHVFEIETELGTVPSCAYHIDCHLKGMGLSKLCLVDRVGPKTIMLAKVPPPDYEYEWNE